MKKTLLAIICIASLTGCTQDNNDSGKSKATVPTSGNGEEETVNDKSNEEDTQAFFLSGKNPYSIETVDIDSVYNDDGDIKKSHTDQEIAKEYMDEDGRIYFDLDNHPVRNIKTNNGNVNNITNYHDSYINISENEAYIIENENEREQTYEFFIMSKPEKLQNKKQEDYRTWEEASNLERGIMQLAILSAPSLNELGKLIEDGTYSGEKFDKLLGEYAKLGSPNTIIPAPQTVLDMQLYENMIMIQSYMGEIGHFEKPEDNQEEFKNLYYEFRQEYNNVVVRVNYTLSEEDPNNPTE